MIESSIIEVEGTFLGAVILDAGHQGRRFYAAHDSVRRYHLQSFSNTEELFRSVSAGYRSAALSRAVSLG
ncbi:hypothetical protein [Acetobacter vaccinii]|uniref:Uncharacterized protein n=1 Tax=Acetobacter vaccinii TaxID=2592655 RepID=A0A5C1YN90_9PROT|nr:hypothetical protein [Acetobacter vaccinii]QEO16945.1 hypothetical protein FLP30_03630 [Acetobacter vaccinii]